eukprot:26001_1
MALPGTIRLKTWLKANNLENTFPILFANDIKTLSDLQVLEGKEDIDEFVNGLNINVIQRNKFKKALSVLIGANEGCQNKDRMQFSPGIHVVPFEKREYRLPMLEYNDYACQGGEGLKQMLHNKGISIVRTFKNKFLRPKADEKEQDVIVIEEQREPEKLFASDQHKVILVCGKTGAGKSTLINSMMNYIYGVQYDDKFRLKLIEDVIKRSDAESCTDHISSYYIRRPRDGNIDYDLTIIDTPGFGDCRGVTKDMQTLEEFKYVFDKILTNINGICFVVKSADNRLDAAQTYVFNNILNLWAKDVADNIFILMTFADGSAPNCIDALNKNEVLKQCKRRIKINNSAFTKNPLSDEFGLDPFDKLFWDMGMKCFAEFFQSLEQVKPKPIEKSKDVLRKRDVIQTEIHHISMYLDSMLLKQQDIMQEKRFIQKHEADINADKEVFYAVTIHKWEKEPTASHLITTCVRHQKSCHPECSVPNKQDCCMMDEHGHCRICSCPHTEHINADYLYVLRSKQVRKSNWDSNHGSKVKHEQAKAAKTKSEVYLKRLARDMIKVENDIEYTIACIQRLRNELEKIALRPHLSTVGDYIDQLIENEQDSEYKDQEKIRMLKKIKQQEQVIARLQPGKAGKLSAKDFMIAW